MRKIRNRPVVPAFGIHMPNDRAVPRLETVFVVFSLLFFSQAIYSLVANPDLQEGYSSEHDSLLLAIQAVIYVLLIGFAALRWRTIMRVARGEASTWLLSGLAVASGLWSADPFLSARRGLILVATTGFGLYLAARFSVKQQLRILSFALAIAAVLSVSVVLLLPYYGIMPTSAPPGWRGVFPHKNPFGLIMALTALVFLIRATGRVRHRFVFGCAVLTATILTCLSRSVTAILVAILVFLIVPCLRVMRGSVTRTMTMFAALQMAVVVASLAVVTNLDSLFRLVQRDSSLTGRTYLWSLVLLKIRAHPLLGYGLNGFWGVSGESASIWRAAGWIPLSAHNGVLDLWLSLGAVGVLMFVVGYVVGLKRAVRLLRSSTAPECVWPLAYMLFFVLCNLDETLLLRQNSIYWVLYVAAVFSVCKTSRRRTVYATEAHREPRRVSHANPSLAGL